METNSKSNDLLARLRSVTLENELKLADFWPTENPKAETSLGSSFKTDSLSNYKPSWEDTDLTLRSTAYSNSEQESDFLSKSQSQQTLTETRHSDEKYSVTSETLKNHENPFAKMSRKPSNLTSKLASKLCGWMTSASCFGILGLVCGGSLTAWSFLARSGSHSMTALGLALTISGLSMLVLVGICQTALHTSGQT